MNDENDAPDAVLETTGHPQEEPAAASTESAEVVALRAELAAREVRERSALAQFRSALLATEPEMDPGLVTGDSFESVHASFAAARSSLARVREALRQELAEHCAMAVLLVRAVAPD